MSKNRYSSPLGKRYASNEMSYIFSDQFKFSTWRKLWVLLAETEKELGINITDLQIEKMKEKIDDIDFETAAEEEKLRRHDVMAHVHAYGKQVPEAKGIIHLGATSAYVGDNTDIIQMVEALSIVKIRIVNLINNLKKFAVEHKNLATLGFTHLQPAQPTTVGKRAALWIQEILLAADELDFRISAIRFRGAKGTTGTQASFMELFENDHEKVKQVDISVTQKSGFGKSYITGQTYPRIVDYQVSSTLAVISSALSKMATDIRLLQHLKEIEEPFEKSQIGSSAMAYKRNPMRSERICSLARFVMALPFSTGYTSSSQWMERTLDDSANKRLAIPEGFMAVDAMLILANNISKGLVVYPQIIKKRLKEEMPFMATEAIIMKAVKNGKDRQEVHERIRVHSMEAGRSIKERGEENDLVERIAGDDYIGLKKDEIESLLKADNFTGRAAEQVEDFISDDVEPFLEANRELIDEDSIDDLNV